MRIGTCVVGCWLALCACSWAAVEKPENIEQWSVKSGSNFAVYLENKTLDPEPVLKALEEFQTALAGEFRVQAASRERVAVYVFETRAGFEKFLVRSGGPKSAAGWYHSGDGSQFIATSCKDLGESDPAWETLRHEGTHLFLFTQIPNGQRLPEWINEGLAVYYSHARVAEGKVVEVSLVPAELYGIQGAIKMGSAEPLRKHMGRRKGEHWDRTKTLESWSIVWWLMKGEDGARRDKLRAYVLKAGGARSPVSEFEKTLGMKVEEAEKEWKKYVLNRSM